MIKRKRTPLQKFYDYVLQEIDSQERYDTISHAIDLNEDYLDFIFDELTLMYNYHKEQGQTNPKYIWEEEKDIFYNVMNPYAKYITSHRDQSRKLLPSGTPYWMLKTDIWKIRGKRS